MPKRYELSDAEWEIVATLFTAHRRTGRPRVDGLPTISRLAKPRNLQQDAQAVTPQTQCTGAD